MSSEHPLLKSDCIGTSYKKKLQTTPLPERDIYVYINVSLLNYELTDPV